jgi:hypothetical protein
MTRVLLLGFVLLTAACGNKTFESLCANQVPAPPACNTACDPMPGMQNNCPTGFHCSPDAKCDLFCTQGGDECGDGYSCTPDGQCLKNSGPGPGSDIDSNCPAVHVAAAKTTPYIQLLIDRSGSMREDFSGIPKFQAVEDALLGKAGGPSGIVPQLQDQVFFGASMFPSNACPAILQIGRAKNNAAAVSTFLKANEPFANDSEGVRNTPTPPAIDAVVADFAANPAPQALPQAIVLATDGLPNECNNSNADTQPQSVMAAKAAFAAGIKMYVLSVGTIARGQKHLQDMANAGLGVQSGAKVFIGNSPTELADQFQQIIGGVLSCDLRLNGEIDPAIAPDGVVTINNTTTLTFGTDWRLDNDHITIHILGSACTTLKGLANPVVDAAFPCGTVIGRGPGGGVTN